MRWDTPKSGDKRIRQGFLFFPKDIWGTTRWLEYAAWEEVWVSYYPIGGGQWKATRWVGDL